METDFLAKLVDLRHDVLVQLRQLARQQAVVIHEADMTRLLSLLGIKQRLLNELQNFERQLEPFRSQDPDQRIWRTPADRQRCREVAERSESLLGEIVLVERECETNLIQRRDHAAVLLQGAHSAARATQGYAVPLESRGSQLDVSCET